jgi:ABC-type uncharacterized transport system substrate-binding protein
VKIRPLVPHPKLEAFRSGTIDRTTKLLLYDNKNSDLNKDEQLGLARSLKKAGQAQIIATFFPDDSFKV